jgi:putrescine aminotransferase
MAQAVFEQLSVLEFVGLEAGISHPLVAELAERLSSLVPVPDPVFSFCNSGSEANDLAFKIARAYHALSGNPRKVKIISRQGSYHGATFGGVSATGVATFRELFEPTVPGFIRAAQPSPGRCGFCSLDSGCSLKCADDVARVIHDEGANTIAAFVGEPVSILQAVKVPHVGYWRRIREICDDNNVLVIADEVVTGFGRTGRVFASEHWGLRPDILTFAKGITSGYVPLGGTVVSGEVGSVFEEHALPHINTYAGHAAACAAAIKNLDILERERLVDNVAKLEKVLAESLASLASERAEIFRTSTIGFLASAEFVLADTGRDQDKVIAVRHECYEEGLAIRAGAIDGVAVVLFYPPLIVNAGEIARSIGIVGSVLARVGVEHGQS